MSTNLKTLWAGLGKLAARLLRRSHARFPSVAFYYGVNALLQTLDRYDWIVVQPDNFGSPVETRKKGAEVFAYLSIGEIEERFFDDPKLDPSWVIGHNNNWNSRVVDLTQSGWKQYLLEERISSLWQMGYRAFFLDTLDSYKLGVLDPDGRAKQASALENVILTIASRFSGVKLLLNRGFEILPKVSGICIGIVAESLFESWNPEKREFTPVKHDDRLWLRSRLQEVRERYGLPVVVVDYVDPQDHERSAETAVKIRELGFIPWISTPGLDTLAAN